MSCEPHSLVIQDPSGCPHTSYHSLADRLAVVEENVPGEAASLHVQAVLGIVIVALDVAAFALPKCSRPQCMANLTARLALALALIGRQRSRRRGRRSRAGKGLPERA